MRYAVASWVSLALALVATIVAGVYGIGLGLCTENCDRFVRERAIAIGAGSVASFLVVASVASAFAGLVGGVMVLGRRAHGEGVRRGVAAVALTAPFVALVVGFIGWGLWAVAT